MNYCLTRLVPPLLLLTVLLVVPAMRAEPSADDEDERILRDAGLSSDDSALLAFFHARARTDIDHGALERLLHQFVAGGNEARVRATAELLGLGSLALQVLRQTVNDIDHREAAGRASRCLPWLEGPSSHKLLTAAAHMLARRKPEGAASALLAFLPYADNPEVVTAVNDALCAVAAPAGKADPALVRGLSDRLGVRRAAAAAALCRALRPEQVPEVRKLLKDPAAEVRLHTARALAESYDAESIPVLIELLADLPAAERLPVEEFLSKLAGEWSPLSRITNDDRIARQIRRDVWMVWWRDTDGAALLSVVKEHSLTPELRRKVKELIAKLGDDSFTVREAADTELHRLGRIALPQLREARSNKDLETARHARRLVERIEKEPMRNLPAAAARLLALRKPEGAAEALLTYLPLAEDENLLEEIKKSLAALAVRDGKLDAALLRALADTLPAVRATAAEALFKGGGKEGIAAVRKLLHDDAAPVRLRVALALFDIGDKDSVPVLIDLLAVLPDEQAGQAETALHQLAGDAAPQTPLGTETAEKKKCRDAWSAWWKVNRQRVDITRASERSQLGYTVICEIGRNRIFEVDRQGKERWAIDNILGPVDVVLLPGQRILIAECNGNLVTERDFKGKILWQKQHGSPVNVQRLPNGNTFIASNQNAIVEVDRTGKEVYRINRVPGGVLSAYRSRHGDIICLTHGNQCLRMDTTGKVLKTFTSNHNGNCLGGLDLLPNDHILVPQTGFDKIVEFDREGKVIREVKAPSPTMAMQLPNGHILASNRNTGGQVYEVDRAGKIVWEYKGVNQVFRVRRR
ncbi:MAG: HEAT repeat domain-containing protein [Gemmataceae bacterium]